MTCKDCIHYDVCDRNIWSRPSGNTFPYKVCDLFKNAADVAPRAEVAREIFEELERMMLDGAIGGKYPAKVINPYKYAELKKKYTGEPQ